MGIRLSPLLAPGSISFGSSMRGKVCFATSNNELVEFTTTGLVVSVAGQLVREDEPRYSIILDTIACAFDDWTQSLALERDVTQLALGDAAEALSL